MQNGISLGILSDIHYAGPAERQRTNYLNEGIASPALRLFIRLYRHYIWLRDPFAHNHLLNRFIDQTRAVDLVIANGDYSCDSAFVGVSDDAACASAAECLGKLRQNFPTNFQAIFGDHEIGKRMMGGTNGGLRLSSFHRARSELELQPAWSIEVGRYVLIGVVSTLLAFPVYESESLVEERLEWQELRKQHLEQIRQIFQAIKPDQKILLFCHDPTALPYLGQEKAVREKLSQVERTVLGHLHSNVVLMKSRLLAGMPPISFLGHTPRRLSMALRMARQWRPFNVLLCPSLAGIELLKDGGFYTVELDKEAVKPALFELHRFGQRIIKSGL
ncbi:MAG: hypothetical protein JWM16_4741 [Verrucomicrobiales bacterium]|nr:hypothetical protein [Verrucomicrobiales bacterium]